ncbi:MAG: hypothetical protein ACXW3C_07925 [Pyrinomonadaceae bacterium]
MSASQASILDFFNLQVGDVGNRGIGGGVDVRVYADQLFGMIRSKQTAKTSDSTATVQAVALTTHKWAARVGKYNNNPIWGEVFQSIQENRRRLKEEFSELE